MEFCVSLLLCVSLSGNSLCVALVKWHGVDVLLEALPLRATLLVNERNDVMPKGLNSISLGELSVCTPLCAPAL